MMRRLSQYDHLAPLLLRLGVGLTFFFAGLGKVMGGTDRVAGFFGSLGIPLPGLMAPFISYLELIGGLALIVGALTRVFGLLFICNMLVAIVVAKWPGYLEKGFVTGFNEIRVELLLLLASTALVLTGAGRYSVDAAVLGDQSEPNLSRADTRPALRANQRM